MSDNQSPDSVPTFSKKATFRLGARELSLITKAVVVIFSIPLLFVGYGAYKNFKSRRDITIAKSNLQRIFQAFQLSAQDSRDRLPTADHWTETALGYLSAPPNTRGGKESYLSGPSDGSDTAYVYNEIASDFSLEPTGKEEDSKIDPSKLVLLIERAGAKMNDHIKIPPQVDQASEQALYKELQFYHFSDDEQGATTVILFANGRIVERQRRDYKQ